MAEEHAAQLSIEPVKAPAPLFPIDEQEFDVYLTDGGTELPLGHKLRKPTKAELVEREQHVSFEQESASETETETRYDSERANRYLWDRIVTYVSGYDLGDNKELGEWREINDLLRAQIPAPHKSRAITGMYRSSVSLDHSQKSRGFKLIGAIEIRVKQELHGAFVVTHVLRRPTESEWLAYQGRSVRTLEVKGSKKGMIRYQTNLSAACDLYDALLERIEGVSLYGEEFRPEQREGFLSAIDAVWKQQVITAFSNDYGPQLRD